MKSMKSWASHMALTVTVLACATGCTGSKDGTKTQPGAPADEPAALATSGAPTTAGSDDEADPMASQRANCPIGAEGVEVAADDTDTGVALTFTTPSGDVDDLRRRVRHMAQMYEMHEGGRGMMWRHMHSGGGPGPGPHGPGMGMGPGMGGMHGRGPLPPVEATVEEVDRGARIILQPKDSAQLDALRERVRMHRARMQTGECWMLRS
jgi:hypothetical protein